MAKAASEAAEKPDGRPLSNKQNQGKIPKKIHKAEREKHKRDQLNDLFIELGHALEPDRQNNGKACILGDASRLLRDLIVQVESLRKENAVLVTESQYVYVEKKELKDENAVLEADISRLQNELRERMQSGSAWRSSTDAASATLPQQPNTLLQIPQAPIAPLYVIPLHQELQPYPEAGTVVEPPKPPPQVMRPHPRYASPSDAWQMELLSRRPSRAQEGQHSSSSSSSLSNNGEEGSVKASVD